MFFKEFGEERDIGELESGCDVFNMLVTVYDFGNDALYSIIVYHIESLFSTGLLDNLRQILGRVSQFLCIVFYRTMAAIVGYQHLHEVSEDKIALFDMAAA